MDQTRLSKLVRQHAETARLLGVDFVPMYRTGAVADLVDEPAPEPVAKTTVRPAPPPASKPVAAPEARVIEPKPIGPPPEGRAAKQAALDELRARYEKDAPHKDFVTAFTNIVFGDGDPAARLVFIGEAPGEEEDKAGIPFVGRSGQLLNKMIVAMGLSREQVYICNVLKTRPINNATPTPRESEACAPYLFEQVSIINPEAIVTLGLPAAKAVLRCEGTMGGLRARWSQMVLPNGHKIPVMPTYHPAFLLRSYTPENRRKVWEDMKMVMDKLGLKATAASESSAANP